MDCGEHFATSCSKCPDSPDGWQGEGWCNGDCVWTNNQCQQKGEGKFICPTTCSKSSRVGASVWELGDCTPPDLSNNTAKNGVTNVRLHWTNNLLRYKLSGPFKPDEKQKIRKAAANIQRNTRGCIRLQEIRGTPSFNYVDVVNMEDAGNDSVLNATE